MVQETDSLSRQDGSQINRGLKNAFAFEEVIKNLGETLPREEKSRFFIGPFRENRSAGKAIPSPAGSIGITQLGENLEVIFGTQALRSKILNRKNLALWAIDRFEIKSILL
jgi:hypothetical protein